MTAIGRWRSSRATNVRNASADRRRSPVSGCSASTVTSTSIDDRQARLTTARTTAYSPRLIGALNSRASIEAVTTIRRQCRWAAMAATWSMNCITRPPKIVPCGFVSPGNTMFTVSVTDPDGGRGSGGASASAGVSGSDDMLAPVSGLSGNICPRGGKKQAAGRAACFLLLL